GGTGETDEIDAHDDDSEKHRDDTVKVGSTSVKKQVPPATPKQLDAFITELLNDTSEEMTWLRLTKLTKSYKKEAGVGLLEAVFREIDKMQKDLLPEKLMLPQLEQQFSTNFKAVVRAIRPFVNDKGRMTPGWKSQVLNTKSADDTEKLKLPLEKDDKL